jgi:hypothetical protein
MEISMSNKFFMKNFVLHIYCVVFKKNVDWGSVSGLLPKNEWYPRQNNTFSGIIKVSGPGTGKHIGQRFYSNHLSDEKNFKDVKAAAQCSRLYICKKVKE